MKLRFSVSILLLASCATSNYEPPRELQYSQMVKKGEVQSLVKDIETDIQKDTEKVDTDGTYDTDESNVVSSSFDNVKEEDIYAPQNTTNKLEANGQKVQQEEFDSVLSADRHSPHKIPIEVNQMVEKWISYFTGKDRERFQRFLNRGEPFKKVIFKILDENEIPRDMYYLAMIESGFVIKARSHASAAGVWQFMAATGKRYGLDYNYYVDERLDPLRATEAAAFYLRELYTVYQSWYLAMAAYNSGENRVLRSIMKSKSRDFWTLVEKKNLPTETMNYVPKFLAAAIIGHNPEKFGFTIAPEETYEDVSMVEVPTAVKLDQISRVTGVSLDDLKKYNPHLRRGMTPPGSGNYELWVPKRNEESVASAYTSLKSYRVANARVYHNESENIAFHRVKRGENLSLIAKKYGMTLSRIKSLNNLRSSKIFVGRKLKVRDTDDDSPSSSTNVRSVVSENSNTKIHKVSRGQNLAYIAKMYGMSLSQLKSLNGFRSNRILIGQRLKVFGISSNKTTASSSSGASIHKVKRGENLNMIAEKYGIALSSLKSSNNLRRNTIYPGMNLKIPSDAERIHKVQRGDNLYEIAKKYGTTIDAIKQANGLRRNSVMIGQVLNVGKSSL